MKEVLERDIILDNFWNLSNNKLLRTEIKTFELGFSF